MSIMLSPLPFGVWFSRHHWPGRVTAWEAVLGLHCLSAFGSVVTICGQEIDRLVRLRLHCLSAFGSVVTGRISWRKKRGHQSPLPFGVWFSRHVVGHSPFVSRSWRVSIAFRRLVQSSPAMWVCNNCKTENRLHCLSAFGSVVTRPRPI